MESGFERDGECRIQHMNMINSASIEEKHMTITIKQVTLEQNRHNRKSPLPRESEKLESCKGKSK